MSGIGFMELLIIFTLLLIPILLLVFLLTRNRLRLWLMRKSEARYFQGGPDDSTKKK